jgi:hypothetical protein
MKNLRTSSKRHSEPSVCSHASALLCLAALLLTSCDDIKKLQSGLEANIEAAEKARKLKEEVLSEVTIPDGKWSWNTKPLSEASRASIVNKLMENTHTLEATFTIYNGSKHAAKDFIVSIAVKANSGTVVRTISSQTLYERLAPGESKTFPLQTVGAIPVGEGKASIRVSDLEVEP